MKRWGVYAVLALAVLAGVWVAKREAAFRALAEREAIRADSIADEAAAIARRRDAEARTLRDSIHAATVARKAAERHARATQAALHTLLDSVEASAADTSVGRDSLARLVTVLAARIRTDSVARAEADSLRDAEWLRQGLAFTAQVAATDRWREAYEKEVKSHAATKGLSRRNFLSRVAATACTLALPGGGPYRGGQVGSAAVGGAGGYLASGVVCR